MLEKVGLRPIPCAALPVTDEVPLLNPVLEVFIVTVELLPAETPETVTSPPELIVAVPKVVEAV